MKTLFPILTLVTNKKNTSTSHYLEFISQCIEGGISAVQLREKYLSPNELYEFGKSLQTLLKPHSIPHH